MRWQRLSVPLILAGFLVGCSGSTSSAIRLADWSAAGDDSEFNNLVQSVYREFEDESGVEVRVEGTPDGQAYVSKLLLSHVAGTAPDIMRLDASSAAVFINNGVLQDLTPYIESDPEFDLSDFYPNVVNVARRGEEIYALPMGFTPMVLYFNRRLFDEAGVQYPDGTWTYDDFLDAAKRLTTEQVYGFEFSNWMPMWILFLWNNGGDVLSPDYKAVGSFDSPQNIEAVQFLDDLVNVHKVSPTLSQSAALGVDLFATNRAAMKIVGHWALVGFLSNDDFQIEDVGIAPVPSNLDSPVTVQYESGLAIMRNSKRPQDAWSLIKHLLSYDVQRRYNAFGIEVSALHQVAAEAGDPVASEEQGRVVPYELEKAFAEIVPSARAPWGTKIERFNLVEQIGQKMMDRVLMQGEDVATALHEAAIEIDEELSRE